MGNLKARLTRGNLTWKRLSEHTWSGAGGVLCGRQGCLEQLGTLELDVRDVSEDSAAEGAPRYDVDVTFWVPKGFEPSAYRQGQGKWAEQHPFGPSALGKSQPPQRAARNDDRRGGVQMEGDGVYVFGGYPADDAIWRLTKHAKQRIEQGLDPKRRRDYGIGYRDPYLPARVECPNCGRVNNVTDSLVRDALSWQFRGSYRIVKVEQTQYMGHRQASREVDW